MKRVDVVYVLLVQEEKVLMVKNKGENDSYYTLPGGAVEDGETLVEAAVREVKEEAGVDIEIDGIFSITEAFFQKRDHHAIFFTLTGRITGGEICITYPDEIVEVTWMDIDEAEEYIHLSKELIGLVRRGNTVPYTFRGEI